ncbi:MAG TPA: twin-arginine translocation signal domain-containing protein [Gemmatimonadales bacterium]|nr:twin-arginine translocation signal domain-containing protein [Gemmatimonadales bacterium]
MLDLNLSTHRRGFLGRVATAAAAVGLGGLIPGRVEAQEYSSTVNPVGDASYAAWLNGIKGKYKQVYDAVEPNGGFSLIWAHVFLLTGTGAYGLPESDLGVVIVHRHSAIPIAFKDAMWEKYKFGEFFKINDNATKAPAVRNVFANLKPGDLPFPEAAVEKLVARGVHFGVCNMAITFYSMMFAQQMGMKAEDIKAEWIANVLPGYTVVPSGVVAVNGAQSRGCSYCYAG